MSVSFESVDVGLDDDDDDDELYVGFVDGADGNESKSSRLSFSLFDDNVDAPLLPSCISTSASAEFTGDIVASVFDNEVDETVAVVIVDVLVVVGITLLMSLLNLD